MAFETRIKVRFSDVDRAGIAYYPRVVHWLHVAFEEFWEGFMGVPYATVLERENLGFPAVDLKVEFVKPTRFGEVLTVRVALEKIGRSSSVFRYDVLGPAGDERVRARVTVVCVALDTLKPTPLPDRYRARFEEARTSGGSG
jgi:YbgC/YbaW family acyl-CoA thioester hydrolase